MALTEAQKRLAEKNRQYWSAREAEQLRHNITDEEDYDRELQRIYSDMLDACQSEINGFYGKYASKEGITIAEAKKRVSQLDIAAYERKAKKYVKDHDFSDKANEEMRLYNATMKINRLEMLKANIGLELISGHNELEKFMEGILKGRTEDELKRQAGILGKTVRNNAAKARSIVNASFHNAKFSDRIWLYQDLLKEDLSKLLQSGLIQGKNPRVLAKEIKKAFQTSTYNSERLMRTELARVQTDAQKQSFERNGFETYQFIVNHGCCDICEEIAKRETKYGKGVYLVEKMQPGENAPPMHPHCRCSTAAYEDDAEYEAWLDYLDKGGTTEEWNSLKKTGAISRNGDIMTLRGFNTTEDPMREVTGAGIKSHPKATAQIVEMLKAEGVEIEHRGNAMCYQPGLFPGSPGRFVIDEEASYSAWKHEEKHFLDDKEDGYPGMRIFQDTARCIQREVSAYDIEIELALEANRPDIAKRLEELKRKEVARYYEDDATED